MGVRRTLVQRDLTSPPLSTTFAARQRRFRRQQEDGDNQEDGDGNEDTRGNNEPTGDEKPEGDSTSSGGKDSGSGNGKSASATDSSSAPKETGDETTSDFEEDSSSVGEETSTDESGSVPPTETTTSSSATPTEDSTVDLITKTSNTPKPSSEDTTQDLNTPSTSLPVTSEDTSAAMLSSSQDSSSSQSYTSTTVIQATPSESSDDGTKITDAGPIAGIAIGGVIALALAIWCIYKCCCAGDGSYNRRMGRKPVSAFQKRTFWDDIPAPGDEEKPASNNNAQNAPSAALPPEPQHAFRDHRPSTGIPTLTNVSPEAPAPVVAAQQRRAPITSGNAAEFTTRRAVVARGAPQQTHNSGNNRTNQATAATSENGQSQWAEVVDEKPLLNPYSAYG